MLKKFPAALCLLCLAACALPGCVHRFGRAGGITVLFSNDIRGEFENCGCDDGQLGGLARKARLLKLEARSSPGMLRLDAGNLFFARRPDQAFEAREFLLKAGYIVSAYNAMGCDALNISENDLLLGMDALERLRGSAAFSFVSSNILWRDSGEHVFEPAVIRQAGGMRVAILGVCPPDGVFMPRLRIQDPAAAIRSTVEALGGRSDFVIVLSGLGLERDRELARQVAGIGLIISARADRLLERAVAEGPTTIVQAFNRGQYVGRVTVRPAGGGFRVSYRPVALAPGLGEEKSIVKLENDYKVQVTAMNQQAFFKARMRRSDPAGDAAYAGSDSCAACHMPQYERWQATPHARAYRTLVRKEAQFQAECLVCHTTGYGEPGGYSPEQGGQSAMIDVQCESCHGPGAGHAEKKQSIVRNGGRQICLGCHTQKNSPHFDYDTYLPMAKCPAGVARQ